MKSLEKFSMFAVLAVALGLGIAGNPLPKLSNLPAPAVLKVCVGCPYGSIQAAVDAAQPGDVVEVYPLSPLPSIQFAWPTEEVTISKPLTVEAKTFNNFGEEVILWPRIIGSQEQHIIFNVTAEDGQVAIRGFVLKGGGIVWTGKADLLLERNRLEEIPASGRRAWIGLGGMGQAQLIENEIYGDVISIRDAHVYLKSNRIHITRKICKDCDYAIFVVYDKQGSTVVLEQNLIEGGAIRIGAGNQVRLEGNILMGGLSSEQSPRWGVVFSADVVDEKGEPLPIIFEANRNVIVRYQKGVAVGYHCDDKDDEAILLKALQIKGQDNVIEQNDQNLCPPDYPWPPGFRK